MDESIFKKGSIALQPIFKDDEVVFHGSQRFLDDLEGDLTESDEGEEDNESKPVVEPPAAAPEPMYGRRRRRRSSDTVMRLESIAGNTTALPAQLPVASQEQPSPRVVPVHSPKPRKLTFGGPRRSSAKVQDDPDADGLLDEMDAKRLEWKRTGSFKRESQRGNLRRNQSVHQIEFMNRIMVGTTPHLEARKHILEEWTHARLLSKLVVTMLLSIGTIAAGYYTLPSIYGYIFVVAGTLCALASSLGLRGSMRVADDIQFDDIGMGTIGQYQLQTYFHVAFGFVLVLCPLAVRVMMEIDLISGSSDVDPSMLKLASVLCICNSCVMLYSLRSVALIVTFWEISHSFLESVATTLALLGIMGVVLLSSFLNYSSFLSTTTFDSPLGNSILAFLGLCVVLVASSMVGFGAAYYEAKPLLLFHALFTACLVIMMMGTGIVLATVDAGQLIDGNCREIMQIMSYQWFDDVVGCTKYGGVSIGAKVETFGVKNGFKYVSSGVGESASCPSKESHAMAWEYGFSFSDRSTRPMMFEGCLQMACCDVLKEHIDTHLSLLFDGIILLVITLAVVVYGDMWLRKHVNDHKERIKMMSGRRAFSLLFLVLLSTAAAYGALVFLVWQPKPTQVTVTIIREALSLNVSTPGLPAKEPSSSCFNDRQDGNETGVDCGGPCEAACTAYSGCSSDLDCVSGYCNVTSSSCRAETPFEKCSNGVRDGRETDVDCGGEMCATLHAETFQLDTLTDLERLYRCALGKSCAANSDCLSGMCDKGVCIGCSDGLKNGDEGDVDCGSRACVSQFATWYANENVSDFYISQVDPASSDESDPDFGQLLATVSNYTTRDSRGLCLDGRTCTRPDQCSSGVCSDGRCASCVNGLRDGDESDVDCGGRVCMARCHVGQFCSNPFDCASGACSSNCASGVCPTTPGKCLRGPLGTPEENLTLEGVLASCSDGSKNGKETDTDCGGNHCGAVDLACADGKECFENRDCASGLCDVGSLTCSSCFNSMTDGNETDVDCGGAACAQRCRPDQKCLIDSDCMSDLFCWTEDDIKVTTQTIDAVQLSAELLAELNLPPINTCQTAAQVDARVKGYPQSLDFDTVDYSSLFDTSFNEAQELVGSPQGDTGEGVRRRLSRSKLPSWPAFVSRANSKQWPFCCPLQVKSTVSAGSKFEVLDKNGLSVNLDADDTVMTYTRGLLSYSPKVIIRPIQCEALNYISIKTIFSLPRRCGFVRLSASLMYNLVMPLRSMIVGQLKASKCLKENRGHPLRSHNRCDKAGISGAVIRVTGFQDGKCEVDEEGVDNNPSCSSSCDADGSTDFQTCKRHSPCCKWKASTKYFRCFGTGLSDTAIKATSDKDGRFAAIWPQFDPSNNNLPYRATIHIFADGFIPTTIEITNPANTKLTLSAPIYMIAQPPQPCSCDVYMPGASSEMDDLCKVYDPVDERVKCHPLPETSGCANADVTWARCDNKLTRAPTVMPSATPTGLPSTVPTSSNPTKTPTTTPSLQPSNNPSTPPTQRPSDSPSSGPSKAPSNEAPSSTPTAHPSRQPSTSPTQHPSVRPSTSPSTSPSQSPSVSPTQSPTNAPSLMPSNSPSASPTTPNPTQTPSSNPSNSPSLQPSQQPSTSPSESPSKTPTQDPTKSPSVSPSASPTVPPTAAPSQTPTTANPSQQPTGTPTRNPVANPTNQPSASPSDAPTKTPSLSPSSSPSVQPSDSPSTAPSVSPSITPTVSPTGQPSRTPSESPSITPSVQPSIAPTRPPTLGPSVQPSLAPSESPSTVPTASPTFAPTGAPTASPTIAPDPAVMLTLPFGGIQLAGLESGSAVTWAAMKAEAEFLVDLVNTTINSDASQTPAQGTAFVTEGWFEVDEKILFPGLATGSPGTEVLAGGGGSSSLDPMAWDYPFRHLVQALIQVRCESLLANCPAGTCAVRNLTATGANGAGPTEVSMEITIPLSCGTLLDVGTEPSDSSFASKMTVAGTNSTWLDDGLGNSASTRVSVIGMVPELKIQSTPVTPELFAPELLTVFDRLNQSSTLATEAADRLGMAVDGLVIHGCQIHACHGNGVCSAQTQLCTCGDGWDGYQCSVVIPTRSPTQLPTSTPTETGVCDGEWIKVFEQLDPCNVVIDFGQINVDTLFRDRFRYDINGETYAYYLRTSAMPDTFSIYKQMLNWTDVDNVLNVDFELYSSAGELDGGTNKWQYCNYNDANVGFPRDCGLAEPNKFKWAGGYCRNLWSPAPSFAFYVCAASALPTVVPTRAPIIVVPTVTVKGSMFDSESEVGMPARVRLYKGVLDHVGPGAVAVAEVFTKLEFGETPTEDVDPNAPSSGTDTGTGTSTLCGNSDSGEKQTYRITASTYQFDEVPEGVYTLVVSDDLNGTALESELASYGLAQSYFQTKLSVLYVEQDMSPMPVALGSTLSPSQLRIVLEYSSVPDMDLVVTFRVSNASEEECVVSGDALKDNPCGCGGAVVTRDDTSLDSNGIGRDIITLNSIHQTVYRFTLTRVTPIKADAQVINWRTDGRCGTLFPLANGEVSRCPVDSIIWDDDTIEERPCCSNLGYCGSSSKHCKCRHCVDYRTFKDEHWQKDYRADGRCRNLYHTANDGHTAHCPTEAVTWANGQGDQLRPCCGRSGRCGATVEHCNCDKCLDYRTFTAVDPTPTEVVNSDAEIPTEISDAVVKVYNADGLLQEFHLPSSPYGSENYFDGHVYDGTATKSARYARLFCINGKSLATGQPPQLHAYPAPQFFQWEGQMLDMDADSCPGTNDCNYVDVVGFTVNTALNGRYLKRYSRKSPFQAFPGHAVSSRCRVRLYDPNDPSRLLPKVVREVSDVQYCLDICQASGTDCEGVYWWEGIKNSDQAIHNWCQFYNNNHLCGGMFTSGVRRYVYEKVRALASEQVWYTKLDTIFGEQGIDANKEINLYRIAGDSGTTFEWYFDHDLRPTNGYLGLGIDATPQNTGLPVGVTLWATNIGGIDIFGAQAAIEDSRKVGFSKFSQECAHGANAPTLESALDAAKCICGPHVSSPCSWAGGCSTFPIRYENTDICLGRVAYYVVLQLCDPQDPFQQWSVNTKGVLHGVGVPVTQQIGGNPDATRVFALKIPSSPFDSGFLALEDADFGVLEPLQVTAEKEGTITQVNGPVTATGTAPQCLYQPPLVGWRTRFVPQDSGVPCSKFQFY